MAWADRERATAKLVQACFPKVVRHPVPRSIQGLLRLTWIMKSRGFDDVRSRRTTTWRGLDEILGTDLERVDPGFSRSRLVELGVPPAIARKAAVPVGIVNFRQSFRPSVGPWIKRNRRAVLSVLRAAHALHDDSQRVDLARRLEGLPRDGLRSKPVTLLSPVLYCLDPAGRFPILNDGTRMLRSGLGLAQSPLPDSVRDLLALYPWDKYGLADAADLDAGGRGAPLTKGFSHEARARIRLALPPPPTALGQGRVLGVLDDVPVEAQTPAARRRYERIHNKITNRLAALLGDRVRMPRAGDERFDAAIIARGGRSAVLVEVKPDLDHRVSLRLAIGQLFDYRHRMRATAPGRLRLAAMSLKRPSDEVIAFLESLGIDVLWFSSSSMRRIAGYGASARTVADLLGT